MGKWLTRPTPLWWSVVRLCSMIAVVWWLGQDPGWQLIGKEFSTSIVRLADEVGRQHAAQQTQFSPPTTPAAALKQEKANAK